MHITEGAELLFEQLIAWSRHLHAHPELSFHEVNTAAYVVEQLKKLPNVLIEPNVGGHGVVATITTGVGPTIALRADMDALPIADANHHDFISTNQGVMHACGHDAHTAILLGAVYLLSEQFERGELSGTVKFTFQPA